jgi:hypothetical protein
MKIERPNGLLSFMLISLSLLSIRERNKWRKMTSSLFFKKRIIFSILVDPKTKSVGLNECEDRETKWSSIYHFNLTSIAFDMKKK